jgi:hypothetical protein
MHIKFEKNGIRKEVKVGFSWTVFFFGWLALAIRGQGIPAVVAFCTFNLASWYYMFAANRLLARSMIENGWVTLEQLPDGWKN